MNFTQWILFFFAVQLIHFLGTWKLYQKAGRKAWEAAVPIYNAYVLMQIIGRPRWWVLLLFIPIINLLMFPVVWVETARSFGQNKLKDTWLVLLSLGFYLYYINYALDVSHVPNRDLNPKSASGEWVSSIVFAVVAATFVHTYFMQPYVIPTGSLERTLRVGDLLFVSKMHYGARVPMTTVAAPMVHDTLPVIGTRSYLKKPQLPYMRLPGFQEVKKNDLVVFSWPADTVKQFFQLDKRVDKPIDKKSNYVKRCVGTPGDSLQVIDGYVFVNGQQLELSERARPMYDYTAYSSKGVATEWFRRVGADEFVRTYLCEQLNQSQLNFIVPYIRQSQNQNGQTVIITDAQGLSVEVVRAAGIRNIREISLRERAVALTDEMAEALRNIKGVDSLVRLVEPAGTAGFKIFPENPRYPWNYDNLGPIYIPGAGDQVALSPEVLPLYKKIIRDYEGHDVSVNGNQVYIDGQPATSFTFTQDYYWMMGDNRDHSEDSRAWGYVPANHIVGKPVFIWMSFDNFNQGMANWKPRWDRIFTTVSGSGEPQSYFRHFLVALAAFFVLDYFWRKRRKKKKQGA
ncbi:signal peptidase I [Robiginitalea myxolifaciens]|uniref:Signal peptidase I n=1 Tax=Robiginitalea myxolifaciens TaxID=400055 RepID=A0A1I6FND5_9FLAO|nr:signal peptidase I [Robiginitalea myxolifaciens]SFR31418.1 signal peptidase I [Robiginitalea myxolifaciens]